MVTRRQFTFGLVGAGAGATLAPLGSFASEIRGALDVRHSGLTPGATTDQSALLQKLLDEASDANKAVFLPEGYYDVSNLHLPYNVRLIGVPGATTLRYRGDGHLFFGEGSNDVQFDGITFDGQNRPLLEYTEALVHVSDARHLSIKNCVFQGSSKSAVKIHRSNSNITGNRITGAADTGVWMQDSRSTTLRDNFISDCGNGGIRVWRWQKAHDGTLITNNRIENIKSNGGGTGQNGNAINMFRADNVMATQNQIRDCAFSAIRANSADNVQILGNSALKSGEVAIFSEFGFEGAIISNNIVDDAAVGVSIVNLDHGGRLASCSNNIIRNLRPETRLPTDDPIHGIGIMAEADTAISGNLIENAANIGIRLGWGPYMRNLTATGNILRDMDIGIGVTVADGAGQALISDNIISETKRGAIHGMRWLEVATRDLARYGAQGVSHVTVERNRIG